MDPGQKEKDDITNVNYAETFGAPLRLSEITCKHKFARWGKEREREEKKDSGAEPKPAVMQTRGVDGEESRPFERHPRSRDRNIRSGFADREEPARQRSTGSYFRLH